MEMPEEVQKERFIEVLGHKDDPRVDILSIVKAYGIPTQFEDDVKQQLIRFHHRSKHLTTKAVWISETGQW